MQNISAPELIKGFAETAPAEVQQAVRQTVVSLLGLAHLYEGRELEEACLKYMSVNLEQVVQRAEFESMSPSLFVKFNKYQALGADAESRKRKRAAA